jgi:hypothetical protein
MDARPRLSDDAHMPLDLTDDELAHRVECTLPSGSHEIDIEIIDVACPRYQQYLVHSEDMGNSRSIAERATCCWRCPTVWRRA